MVNANEDYAHVRKSFETPSFPSSLEMDAAYGPAAPSAPCYVRRRGAPNDRFTKTREDAEYKTGFYPRAAAEIRRCRTREEALAYHCEEDWLQEPPPKRMRLAEPCTIRCYGLANMDWTLAGIGVYFGTGDERNLSARIKGTGCGTFNPPWHDRDYSELSCREWAELCAVYVAIKRAPANGKVIISTPSTYTLAEIDYACRRTYKNSTFDTIIDSIAHKIKEGKRRIKLIYDKTPLAENPAVHLAHLTLDPEQLYPTLPRLPLPEDRYPPHHVWGIRE
jgi:hypothetical protein